MHPAVPRPSLSSSTRRVGAASAVIALGLGLHLDAAAGTMLGPVPQVVGDGVTQATIVLYTDDPGVKLKVKPALGRLDEVTPFPGGYTITWTPPQVMVPTPVPVTIQVRGAEKLDLAPEVRVVPAYGGGFGITFDPPTVAAGGTTQVTVKPITDVGRAATTRVMRASVSSGTVTDLVATGDGSWVARYTAPKATDPLQVVFAVIDAAAPYELQGRALVPVTVDRSVTFDAPADSNNVLVYGSREYGPNKASPAGKVAFDVGLNPALPSAQLQTVAADGSRTDRAVDVPMKVGPALALLPLPAKVPGAVEFTAVAWCVEPSGGPCAADKIQWTVAGGKLIGSSSPTTGASEARIDVPSTGTVDVTATLGDLKVTAKLTALPPPVQVTLTSAPPVLDAAARDFSITARLKDPKGAGVLGRIPTLEVVDATASGKGKDNGDGTYTFGYRLNTAGKPATVRAVPPIQPTGLPARRLVVFPERSTVAGDGSATVGLVIVAEDALGMPVPDVAIQIAVPVGDGAVAPTATTGKTGVVRVPYRAGNAGGLSLVQVSGAGLEASTAVWQVVAGQPVPELPFAGSAADRAAIERWRTWAPSITTGQAAPPAPVAAVPTATVAVPVAAATPGAPTVPVAAATPGEATAKVPKSGGGGGGGGFASPSGGPAIRLRGGLFSGPFSYTATLDGTADDYTAEASYKLNPLFGAVGFDVEAEGWVWEDRIGFVGDVKMRVYNVEVAGDQYSNSPIDFNLGARYRFWSGGPLAAFGGLGYLRTSESLFVYSNALRSAAEFVDEPVGGVRAEAGLRFERDNFLGQFVLAETFGPAPVLTAAHLTFDIPIPGSALGVMAGAGIDYRSMRFKIGDDAKMKVNRFGQDVRLGLFLPLL